MPLTDADVRSGLLDDPPRLLQLMQSALHAQRRIGLSGAWHYDFARHRQLLNAYRTELRQRSGMR